jgi:hypothetical protein
MTWLRCASRRVDDPFGATWRSAGTGISVASSGGGALSERELTECFRPSSLSQTGASLERTTEPLYQVVAGFPTTPASTRSTLALSRAVDWEAELACVPPPPPMPPPPLRDADPRTLPRAACTTDGMTMRAPPTSRMHRSAAEHGRARQRRMVSSAGNPAADAGAGAGAPSPSSPPRHSRGSSRAMLVRRTQRTMISIIQQLSMGSVPSSSSSSSSSHLISSPCIIAFDALVHWRRRSATPSWAPTSRSRRWMRCRAPTTYSHGTGHNHGTGHTVPVPREWLHVCQWASGYMYANGQE